MKKLLLILFITLSFITFGQDAKNPTDSIKKPIIPFFTNFTQAENSTGNLPSPDAAGLGRYGEYEVDLANGLVPIQIPIYTIECGKLKLPISLNYHSSGVKVNDIATSVGLNWSLFSGGVITRSVQGKPDEKQSGYLVAPLPLKADEALINNTFLCYIGKLAALDGTQMDGSPDLFFYNFNGNSGRFQLARHDRLGEPISPVFVTVPYKPIKVDYTINGTDIISFKIIDTDGTIYWFGKRIGSSAIFTETTFGNTVGSEYISSWYLNRIESNTSNDAIEFAYDAPIKLKGKNIFATSLYKNTRNGTSTTYTYLRSETEQNPEAIFPYEISFKNGKVQFEYVNDRQDLLTTNNTPASRLSNIVIFKKIGAGVDDFVEIKNFGLTQSYFNTNDGYSMADKATQTNSHATSSILRKILKLDNVTEYAPDNNALPPYKIKYNDSQPLSIYAGLGQDFWGYYNGKNPNESRLLTYDSDTPDVISAGTPYTSNLPSPSYAADRTPDINFVQRGIITELAYPTGGKTKFEFEENKNTSGTLGAGLRIKSIENYATESAVAFETKTTYDYTGSYNVNPSTYSALTAQGPIYKGVVSTPEITGQTGQCITNTFEFVVENLNFMLGSGSSNVAYHEVQIKEVNSSNIENGKTIKTFEQSEDQYQSLQIVDNNPGVTGTPNPLYALPPIFRAWKRGQLKNEKYYKGSTLLKEITQNYTDFLPDYMSYAYIAKALYTPGLISVGSQISTCDIDHSTTSSVALCNGPSDWEYASTKHIYEYRRLDTEIGYRKLTSIIETNYDENGGNGVTTTTTYSYHPDHNRQQLTSQTLNDSQGRNLVTSYQYPNDFAGNSTYDLMITRNIIEPIVKETVIRGGAPVSEAKRNYAFFSSYPQVQTEELKIGYGVSRTMVTYNNYDFLGNLTSLTTLNGQKLDIEWYGSSDYGKTDLIKKIKVGGVGSALLAAQIIMDYEPLVGVSLITDLNGIMTTNIYDNHKRLTTIEDHKGFVTKDIRYQYASQIQQSGLGATPSTDVNFVATRIPRTEQDNIDYNIDKTINSFNYSDGLGRSLQSLIWKGSADKSKDILVTTSQYDAYGRNNKIVLSSPSDDNLGQYKVTAHTLAELFYNDTSPTSESIFETSPLSRTKQQFGPGIAWRGGTPKPQNISYNTTGAADVPLYTASGNYIVKGSANYPANSLFKTEITDEQGNKTTEIKDTEGNLIQKRIQEASGEMTTHYIYNEFGQLKAIIQPKAYPLVSDLIITSEDIYYYNYDDNGRLIEKKTPSAGIESMVYDKWDRLVYSQNTFQRRPEQLKWIYYKYDALNRLVVSGTITDVHDRLYFQNSANASLASRFETRNNIDPYYSLTDSDPQVTIANVNAATYYDDYNTWLSSDLSFSSANAYDTQQTSVLGLPTGGKFLKTDNTGWQANAIYYDYKYRPIQTFNQNYFGRADRTDLQYNFASELLQTRSQYNYKKNGTTDETTKTLTKITPNHLGMPTKVEFGNFVNASANARKSSTLADPTLATIANYAYDDISRLTTKTFLPSAKELVCQLVALPLDLIEFKAVAVGDTVNLNWQVANEKDFSKFELQRSYNAKEFGSIATIQGKKQEFYHYSDWPPHPDGLLYYRLKIVDNDGSFAFSKIVSVDFDKNRTYLNLENPVQNGEFLVETNLVNPQFRLTNATGQKMEMEVLVTGQNFYRLKTKNANLGVYYLTGSSAGSSITKKLILK